MNLDRRPVGCVDVEERFFHYGADLFKEAIAECRLGASGPVANRTDRVAFACGFIIVRVEDRPDCMQPI